MKLTAKVIYPLIHNWVQHRPMTTCVPEFTIHGVRMDAFGFLAYEPWTMRGFEIKVTRSDFLSDKKWQLYLSYVDYFAFVSPEGVVNPNELPPEIGLYHVVFNSQYNRHELKVVKKCKRLKNTGRDEMAHRLKVSSLIIRNKMQRAVFFDDKYSIFQNPLDGYSPVESQPWKE